MSTRLQQQYPDLATWLRALPPEQQRDAVGRVARHAARATDLPLPDEGTDLGAWSADLDARGWSDDAAGDPHQDERDFARARAAAALRHAADHGSATSAEDSLYESIAALGLDVVRQALGRAR